MVDYKSYDMPELMRALRTAVEHMHRIEEPVYEITNIPGDKWDTIERNLRDIRALNVERNALKTAKYDNASKRVQKLTTDVELLQSRIASLSTAYTPPMYSYKKDSVKTSSGKTNRSMEELSRYLTSVSTGSKKK